MYALIVHSTLAGLTDFPQPIRVNSEVTCTQRDPDVHNLRDMMVSWLIFSSSLIQVVVGLTCTHPRHVTPPVVGWENEIMRGLSSRQRLRYQHDKVVLGQSVGDGVPMNRTSERTRRKAPKSRQGCSRCKSRRVSPGMGARNARLGILTPTDQMR